MKQIRNFSIIAHIDHGKSTLADRILEHCHSVSERDMKNQMLDSMDLERERGITIKLNSVRLNYKDPRDNQEYILNLIDTPGHVDFAYEVSRSLASSEAALLLVDATQGVQPQTIANMYLALENNLEIIPIINKVDMESADVEKTKHEIETILGIKSQNAICISAKTGLNIEKVFDAIIDFVPPAKIEDEASLKALVFDSFYDAYRGVVMYIRVTQGQLNRGDHLRFVQNNVTFEIVQVGFSLPNEQEVQTIGAGEVGWIVINNRDIKATYIGDTITHVGNKDIEPLSGYKPLKSMVFSGFYPIDSNQYIALEEALEKISLSDSSLIYEKETSQALGFGFRVGFLGLLHLEIIQERIEREFNISLIATAPSVIYKINLTDKSTSYIQNPSEFPDKSKILSVEEPYVRLSLFSPQEHIGKLMELIHEKRGQYVDLEVISDTMNSIIYEIPLAEIVFNFFNSIKSISKGYASFDYELIGYKVGNLTKMDILIHNERVDAFSLIVDKDNAYYIGRNLVQKLKTLIPRQNFEIPIQASIGGKIISRETVKAYRKDVTAKLYGGDVSRKKKLLEKQKKGKKKMKQIGSVQIPQEAFIKALKTDND